MNRIKEIYDYRDMIYSMVKRELRGRYQRSVLGIFWTMLNPLFQIIIYTIIFTYIFPSAIDQYYIYLMTGLIPWTFFSESLIEGASSIIVNGDLTRKIYFPRDVLVISKVTSKFINFLLALIIVFFFLLISGRGISFIHILFLPVVMITEYFLALGFTLIFSAITVYFRDMEYIVGVIMMGWVWATPIMYALDGINPILVKILYFNPMTHIINAYHCVLYYKVFPNITSFFGITILSFLLLCIGEMIFVKLEGGFAEEL